MNNEILEYEILIESFGAHTGEGRRHQKLIEAELASPEDYVRDNDNWPLYDIQVMPNGDVVIYTKSGEGNVRKYTFMKV